MTLVVQICMVVVTIALVVIAALAIRLMLQMRELIESANRSLVELPGLIEKVKGASDRVEQLLYAFSRITGSVEVAVLKFEGLATRTSALTNTVLDEIERPVSRLAAVLYGIRAGASQLIERWRWRAGGSSPSHEGEDHVGEQQWFDDGGRPARRGDRGRTGLGVRANGR